jgi:hypothetical protein
MKEEAREKENELCSGLYCSPNMTKAAVPNNIQ